VKFATRAIHSGQEPEEATGAAVVPIFQTSNFVYEGVGKHKGYQYSRLSNPTRTALETCLASLEGAEFAFAFSSGMAAEDTVFRLLAPGDHVVLGSDVYGGTRRLFDSVLTRAGLQCTSVDMTSRSAVEAAIAPNTKMMWIETPSNPGLRIADIQALADVASKSGVIPVVDNTFATPWLQNPLRFGAAIVVHSTTKYLGGHSDVVGGAVCTSDPDLAARLRLLQQAAGAIPGPFDAWLVLRGIKTLALRMDKHCENAMQLALMLSDHPGVGRVWYPGLPSHPEHEIAARQMTGFGGMICFEMATPEQALKMVSATKLFFLAESLGGVESLIGYPAAMSHASVAGTPFAVSDRLVRLSVGIEDAGDLAEDLAYALDSVFS